MNELEYRRNLRIQAVRDAMQDLLEGPGFGIVPVSAAPFYDAKSGRISTTKIRLFLEAENDHL